MIHDRPHQETRPNEQGEHASANASNAPPSARRGGARHCAIDAPEDTNASKERMTNDEKRTIRTTHTYETLLDGGGQSRQTARPTRVGVRAARALEVAILRTERRAGEQASKEKTRELAAGREYNENDRPARSHLM